ncbi:hypothetical protein Tcan_07503 [Toxocara canis]|uniref:Uncharacterized protein n=1 Tax=Toxocara canis TaxID=6265 RepID=A0A0B2VM43_TOXCA|nr:hypothetical protein Tcan_07503 [Toxocara canis]
MRMKPLREIGAQQSLDEECAPQRSSELNKYLYVLKRLIDSGDGMSAIRIILASSDAQWLAQYQYILNWCYCQLRFICDPKDRRRLFNDIKEKYRQMFEQLLNVREEDKLQSYLHWSQICYQYAEFVDDESLAWCVEIITNAKQAISASSSNSSTLSKRKESTVETNSKHSEALPFETRKVDNHWKRYIESVDLIRGNVEKTENVRASFQNGGYSEKIVM